MLKWLKQCVDGDLLARLKGTVSVAPDAAQFVAPLDLTDPKVIASFKAISADLRGHKPVCPVSSGGFLLLDPDDVKSAFSNKLLSNQPSRFSALANKNIAKYSAASVAANIPPFLDAPRHIEVRQWLSRAFFERLRDFDPFISDIASKHVARADLGHTYWLVEDLARDFVVDTIGQFVGLDLTPSEMKKFTGALFKLFAPAADAETFAATNKDLTSARVQLTEALQRRRNDQKPCFLNILDQNDLAGVAGLEKDMMIADNALLILADGVENVEAAIANVMLRSAHVPDPITSDFVRDTIKLDTPGQTISRIAAQDFFIGGEKISSGTPLFLSLASANEGTSSNEDFSFGMGRHKCIGEQLAISMITAFCSQLAERKPQTNIADLHYAAMFGHKWPRGVTLTPTC